MEQSEIGKTPDRPARLYVDGVFDMTHYGHFRLFQQCRRKFPFTYIIIGVAGDQQCIQYKNRTVMNQFQRSENIRHSRDVDEVICPCPWQVTPDFIQEHQIDFVCHDDAPYGFGVQQGQDVYAQIKRMGKFLPTQRTESVSTTELISRILKQADYYSVKALGDYQGLTQEDIERVRKESVQLRNAWDCIKRSSNSQFGWQIGQMGATVSKVCAECFLPNFESKEELSTPILEEISLEHMPVEKVEEKTEGVQEQTAEESESENLQVEFDVDYLESLLQEAKDLFFQEVKVENLGEMQKIFQSQTEQVYTKEQKQGYYVKSFFVSQYGHKEVADFIMNRDKFKETQLNEVKIISRPAPKMKVFTTYFKGMLMVSPRESLIVCRQLQEQNKTLIVSTSCQHPEYPQTEKVIRASIKVSAYLIESSEQEGIKSKISSLSIGCLGGSIPAILVKKISASKAPEMIKSFRTNLEKFMKLKNEEDHS